MHLIPTPSSLLYFVLSMLKKPFLQKVIIKADTQHVSTVIEELKATGKFELMDLHVDEAEHSMEMHLPYLAKVFRG